MRPVAFLVVSQGKVKLLPVGTEAFIDRVFDLVPNLVDRMTKTALPVRWITTPCSRHLDLKAQELLRSFVEELQKMEILQVNVVLSS